MSLYVAGELIPAGDVVVLADADGMVYSGNRVALHGREFRGTIIGNAGEQLRDGFRTIQRDGKIYEDDA